MPAAVIGGMIAAGGEVGSAAIQANSVGNAVDQEQASAQKALDLQSNIYNQTRSDYAPFRAAGTAALPNLAAYANHPVVTGGYGQGYQPGFQPGMTLGQMAQPGGGAPSALQGPMVTLMDDSGARRQVPREQAQRYISQGARVVQ